MARDFDTGTARRADPAQPTPEQTASMLASGGMVGPEAVPSAPSLAAAKPTIRRSHWNGISPGATIAWLCLIFAAGVLIAAFAMHGVGLSL